MRRNIEIRKIAGSIIEPGLLTCESGIEELLHQGLKATAFVGGHGLVEAGGVAITSKVRQFGDIVIHLDFVHELGIA